MTTEEFGVKLAEQGFVKEGDSGYYLPMMGGKRCYQDCGPVWVPLSQVEKIAKAITEYDK